ncbi:glycosyltransferase family 2 protein [Alteromonas portus]|uniref:Glycosyltransferase family 2 protein n=1 Tax=Alteromonas portus TaxID=2565549 RepID=A0A4U0ZAC3_9ALTE|nr:glycosyltransferase family 2 protein [Alteromonas portus]TKB01507.1 glycosyltransferase family 2 protein [Alteromonas portus]
MLSVFKKNKGSITEASIKNLIETEFDAEFYAKKYKFLETDDYLNHFLKEGWKEGLDPCEWFSTSKYLIAYPDVAASGVNPFFHYLHYGKAEGRNGGLVAKSDDDLRSLVRTNNFADSEYENSKYFREACDILGTNTEFSSNDFERFANWTKIVPKANGPHPHVKAFIDSVKATGSGSEAVTSGWVIRKQNSFMWFETNQGQILPMRSAFFQYREDVYNAFEDEMTEALPLAGFVQALTACNPGTVLKIYALSSEGAHEIAQGEVERLESTPKKIAEFLASINTPLSELPKRISKIDEPLISSAIAQKNTAISAMPHEVYSFGKCSSPEASIIIPLYGRVDFVEAQMQCFSKDVFVQNHCELIYVIDDPTLVEPFKKLSSDIYALYGIPFKVIWGGLNRGFSGANNLGVEYATAHYLLFLNSDAFPTNPGWVEQLTDVLNSNADYGVVSPRLLFADGSIQHAGMEFVYRNELSIWTNHHPNMGIDPSLDPHSEATVVPAVTGACMLMTRDLFDSVGGWDNGYLIGDFEDSDLCFKIREQGKHCVYVPTVELTHLERQSFNLTGAPDFRTKVVIYNATRHQNKWSSLLQQSVSKG